jgi:hypothetical protein
LIRFFAAATTAGLARLAFLENLQIFSVLLAFNLLPINVPCIAERLLFCCIKELFLALHFS